MALYPSNHNLSGGTCHPMALVAEASRLGGGFFWIEFCISPPTSPCCKWKNGCGCISLHPSLEEAKRKPHKKQNNWRSWQGLYVSAPGWCMGGSWEDVVRTMFRYVRVCAFCLLALFHSSIEWQMIRACDSCNAKSVDIRDELIWATHDVDVPLWCFLSPLSVPEELHDIQTEAAQQRSPSSWVDLWIDFCVPVMHTFM